MDSLTQYFTSLSAPAPGGYTLESLLLTLLLSFVLGQLLAWVYIMTHSGQSYSMATVQSFVLIAVIVSIVISVIGNNIYTAFGLLGALSIIRFRNVLKDTRDTAFIFMALTVGMATGSQHFALAIIGTVAVCMLAIYLWMTGFGARTGEDAFIRFHLDETTDSDDLLKNTLRRHCFSTRLVSRRRVSKDATDTAFEVSMRNPDRDADLLEDLSRINGISQLSVLVQPERNEV